MDQSKGFFLEDIWNDGLIQMEKERQPEKRNHIWAGEIGKSFFDRYLKMNGVPKTETLEPRVKRKFKMGIMIEEMVGRALAQFGVLRSSQERIEVPECEEHLKITGRMDFVAGVTDWAEAKAKIAEYKSKQEELTKLGYEQHAFSVTDDIAVRVAEQLSMRYPNGIPDTPLEIKSVNSMLFWAKKDYLNEAYPHHIFQLFTYLKAKNLPVGRIVYFSKDDATIKEMTVRRDDKALELMWKKDIKKISEYIRNQQEPPRPEPVIFDGRGHYGFQHKKIKYKTAGCYKENWQIKWSDYFKLITNNQFETVDDWVASVKPEISARNKELKAQFLEENNL